MFNFYGSAEEKVICAKMIEDLKSKHKIEIDTLNTVAKQNANDYASQELIQIVAEHKQQFEKAKEIVTFKNNTVRIHYLILFHSVLLSVCINTMVYYSM